MSLRQALAIYSQYITMREGPTLQHSASMAELFRVHLIWSWSHRSIGFLTFLDWHTYLTRQCQPDESVHNTSRQGTATKALPIPRSWVYTNTHQFGIGVEPGVATSHSIPPSRSAPVVKINPLRSPFPATSLDLEYQPLPINKSTTGLPALFWSHGWTLSESHSRQPSQ